MKQWFVLDRTDWLVILLSYPAVLLDNYLILGDVYIQQLPVFGPVTFISTFLYLLCTWSDGVWMKYMRFRYPDLSQSVRRIFFCLPFYLLTMVLLLLAWFGVFEWLPIPGYRFRPVTFGWALLIGTVSVVLSAGILEAVYFFQQWKSSVAREYELKQLHMQRQLDVLKQQVNPHFLFNSLNSLISLIGENPGQAEVFAEELSSVYRYVLRANEQNLTDLRTELSFIDSYYHLLKTRHGHGLNLVVSVDDSWGTYRLPPLTLQLLVENAVKHNVVLPKQPLTIEIRSNEKAELSVCNTLQKKRLRVLSNGVGLSNIMAKYQMLGQPTPTVQENNGQFVVTLPLIEAN